MWSRSRLHSQIPALRTATKDSGLPTWKDRAADFPPQPIRQTQSSFLLLIRPTPGHLRGHLIRTLWESELSQRIWEMNQMALS